MCRFWSAVLEQDGNVLWSPRSSSHEAILAEHGIADSKLHDRSFVRFEIAPDEKDKFALFSEKRGDWRYKVDEPGTLPEWYANDTRHWESVCWKEWRDAMKRTLWKLNLDAVQATLDEVKGIKYLDQHDDPLPEWKVTLRPTLAAARDAARDAAGDAAGDAARNAAGDAARGAAWDAARNAAGDAAWDAAWGAAGDAVRNAARDAAWNAAGDAAWNAAWGAAWDAALAVRVRPAGDAARGAAGDAARDAALAVRVSLLKGLIDEKHVAHIEARMDVWRRGWALCCDVKGVLYVYGFEGKGTAKNVKKEG
jgi:hypothetical protein